ncbi:MAG: hypothetical protein DRP66_01305 [Planctomycetota bacterium]|nr:MAG: hypothetical protein DRP66_01305 [Planctomycetota bacterium]
MEGRFAAKPGLAALLAICLALAAGCGRSSGPRMRRGMYFGSLTGIRFLEHDRLGKHQCSKRRGEKNGLVYTSRGGFLDIGHVREAADRTAYIAGVVHENLDKNETDFSFEVIEPARYFVTIRFPECWDRVGEDRREEIITDISIRLGQYLGHTTLIWHEMVTWFGYTSTMFFSEHISAFSCEDPYSDLLGTRLATFALRDTERSFEDAMTKVLDEELERLGVRPAAVARRAVRKTKGKWYKGGSYFFARVIKRNFDTGADDGFITPWLVPLMDPNSQPEPCPAPNLDFLADYGFSMKLQIEPKEWQKNEILATTGKHNPANRITPAIHFPLIMEHIKKEAVEKYGPDVDVPTL